jgi:hypothetical protein
MNEHTQRILERMLSLLTGYREGDVIFTHLVRSLEGSLSALEEKLPRTFYDTWYEHWGELETYLAIGIEKERKAEILKEIEALDTLIKQNLKQ